MLNNIMSNEKKIIKEVFSDRKYLDIRLIIIITASLPMLLWVKDSIEISCLLSIFLNIVLVIFITTSILNRMSLHNIFQQIRAGITLGGLIGAIYATMTIIDENIDYFFFGGRLQSAHEMGFKLPPLSYDSIVTVLFSALWIWLFLVFVSAFSGIIAGVITRAKNKEK